MSGVQVLIVEDDAETVADVCRGLGDNGYRICGQASTGAEALDQAARTPPDVALVEIGLAGEIDGPTVARRFRETLGIPVVYLAARCDPESFDPAPVTAAGGCGPFVIHGLCCAIEMALHTHRAAPAQTRPAPRCYRILRNTRAGYFRLDRRGCYAEVNQAWLDMHGFTSSRDVIGHDMALVLPAEDVAQARRDFAALLRGESLVADEGTRRCRDGTLAYHSLSVSPVRQDGRIVGAEGFLIDITERQCAEEALRAKQAHISTLFAAVPDMLILKDRDLVYQAVNPAFCRYMRREEEEIVGSTDFDLFPVEEARAHRREDMMVIASGCPIEQDKPGVGRDGGTWWYVVKTPVAGRDGEVDGVAVSIRDVTARKKFEEARRTGAKDQ